MVDKCHDYSSSKIIWKEENILTRSSFGFPFSTGIKVGTNPDGLDRFNSSAFQ